MLAVLLGAIWLAHVRVLSLTGTYNTEQAIGFNIAALSMPLALLCVSSSKLYQKVECRGSFHAWRFVLGWISCSFSLSFLYNALTESDTQKLGAVLLTFLSGGLSLYLFRGAYKRAAPSQTAPRGDTSVRLGEAQSADQSVWFKDLKNWIESRFEDSSLKSIDSVSYRQHLYRNVVRLRSMVLTDAELMSPLKGTAFSLIFSTQLYIVGTERNQDRPTTLAAMFAVLPDYPSFYALEKVKSDASISLPDIARMFFLEGEMFSVLYLFLSGDKDYFQNTLASATELASKYWDKHQQPFVFALSAAAAEALQGWQGSPVGPALLEPSPSE